MHFESNTFSLEIRVLFILVQSAKENNCEIEICLKKRVIKLISIITETVADLGGGAIALPLFEKMFRFFLAKPNGKTILNYL